jgi:2-hydroxy-6-oxonona-2,4-dienedioate hydrolase
VEAHDVDAPAPEAARTLTGDGPEVSYLDVGSGAPLVLIHGAGPGTSGWTAFRGTIHALAQRFRVLAPDMPGWGRSAAVAFDPQVQVDALVRLLDANGIARASFVGHSLGGARVVDFATIHPERVDRIVTISAPAPGVNLFSSVPGEGGKATMQAYLEPTPERMAELGSVLFYDQVHATPERAREMSDAAQARPEHLANFHASLNKIGGSIFAAAEQPFALARIAAPALVIHGRDDRVVPYEAGLRLTTSIPDARMLLLGRCGHYPQAEHSAEVTRAIMAFVGGNADTTEEDR